MLQLWLLLSILFSPAQPSPPDCAALCAGLGDWSTVGVGCCPDQGSVLLNFSFSFKKEATYENHYYLKDDPFSSNILLDKTEIPPVLLLCEREQQELQLPGRHAVLQPGRGGLLRAE